MSMTPLQIVEECNRLIMDHRAFEAIEKYIAEDFIEHSPLVRGGDRVGFIEHVREAGFTDPKSPRMKMVVDRMFASGNMVVTHVHVETAPGAPILVFMDIYRVEGGKIVEHWDVMQPVPETSVNGRVTMY
jgi:predicted SnoaL-like aldol condensation-catalyzing enzyme